MKRTLAKKSAPASASAKRVLIVDDHPFMRVGLTESLGREPGLTVCGAVASAEDALDSLEKLRPDVVIADLNLPGKSGLEMIKDLSALRPGLPVIVLSMHDEGIFAERCLRAGARGYVMKNEGPEKLPGAIHQVLAGGIHVSPRMAARIVEIFSGQRENTKQTAIAKLSDREFEIFRLIGEGLSTDEVADRLHISPKTVETHRVHIKTKLEIGTAQELIAYAARWVGAQGAAPEGE